MNAGGRREKASLFKSYDFRPKTDGLFLVSDVNIRETFILLMHFYRSLESSPNNNASKSSDLYITPTPLRGYEGGWASEFLGSNTGFDTN